MRFAHLLVDGRRTLAVRRGGSYVDLSALGFADELGALLRAGIDAQKLAAAIEEAPAIGAHQFAPLIAEGAKILCLGLNYVDHANEAKYEKPQFPVVFTRYASSFVGHEQAMELPLASDKFDFESELAVVIGKGGRRIAKADALAHVAGYTLLNDGSVRDYQRRTPQWTLGKNFDRSGAVGPELITPDELPPGARGLQLTGRLNGAIVQQASTTDMIFDVETSIASISEAMALQPGDVIAMGTPSGVGAARTPPLFMKAGDVFEIEVERVGLLRNPIRSEG